MFFQHEKDREREKREIEGEMGLRKTCNSGTSRHHLTGGRLSITIWLHLRLRSFEFFYGVEKYIELMPYAQRLFSQIFATVDG